MEEVIVIGGGPAGMIGAIMAARNNKKVLLIEKNDKLGKKLYITGKGRCNITNESDVDELFNNIITNNKFLYSALYTFDSYSLINFFNELGLKTKTERGNRVFPKSDKSSDVIKVLDKELKRLNVKVLLNTSVKNIIIKDNTLQAIKTTDNEIFNCSKVIVATGGISYSSTGSTGDGYKFAKKIGHNIKETVPGLVPLEVDENWVPKLQGVSLKNVNIKFINNNKVIYENFGEMLFTHYGLTGPLILSGSSYLPKNNIKDIKLEIDLKPSLSFEQLDKRVVKDFSKYSRKNFSNALNDLLPKKMIPVIIDLSTIPDDKQVDQITKEERKQLVNLLKSLKCTIKNRRDFNEAIITRGGINIKEINPNTMESKLIDNIYFAGEVLDLDALTGGYNLQIAFSTGYLAGISV
jgi:predicted Rossmann fold flavoprotein